MKKQFNFLSASCFILLFGLFSLQTYGQSSYQSAYQIFESKCFSCHSGASPAGGLDLDLSESDLYNALIEANSNASDFPLVDPGYPERSFMYRKMNNGLYPDSELTATEGQSMPAYGGPELLDHERETVRQWILYGAKQTGVQFDPETLETYYTEPAAARPRLEAPPAPEVGMQLHLGSIFLEPSREVEYKYKYEINLEEGLEINKIEVVMNSDSHHFIFFKFNGNQGDNDPDGLSQVSLNNNIDIGGNETTMIGSWAYSKAFDLPEGTAYSWDQDVELLFNYHILNYSQTQILPADVYINIHTQPEGTALKEMHSNFILNENFFQFLIPNNGQDTPFTESITGNDFNQANPSDSIHIWSIGSHTHARGRDYDIYRRTAAGEKGEQIYEGFYNYDQGFDNGFYDYAEPPFRNFGDDYVTIKAGDGLIHEAVYNYNEPGGPAFLNFGLTTEDEMMGVFCQYLVGDISMLPGSTSGVDTEDLTSANAWNVFPNPYTAQTQIQYELQKESDVVLKVFNTVGQEVTELVSANQPAGTYTQQFSAKDLGLGAGLYILQLSIDGQQSTKTVLEME